jgi:uncharacterized damage-inducible protein DinB
MQTSDVLIDAFERVHEDVRNVLDRLDEDQLATRPQGSGNSIAWLVWHLTRIQDDHIAALGSIEQRWTASGWYDRFGLPFDESDHGYGHTSEQVGAVRVPADLLLGYYEAVHEQTVTYLQQITPDELDRVVDTNWDPPVTAGVRVVSVVNDDTQHVGQAAYVRGLIT